LFVDRTLIIIDPRANDALKHHCRGCGHIFCKEHCNNRQQLPPEWGYDTPQRVCNGCLLKFDKYARARKEKEEDTGRPILSLVLPVFNENVGVESGILIAQFYLRDKAYQYHSALLAMGTCLYAP